MKLGGSSITYKKDESGPPYDHDEIARNYRIKENIIRKIGAQLSNCDPGNLVIVHGGGTHGHRTESRWREGAVKGSEPMKAWEVSWRMNQLTNSLIKVLGREKIPGISIPTSTIALSDQGEVLEILMGPIRRVMERGCIPVLRGDIVPDVNGGWSVISGDTLIKEICRRGKEELEPASKVIMVLNSNGFIDPDTGETVQEIDPYYYNSNVSRWEESLRSDRGDVSGGIWTKVQVCHSLSQMGVETFLIGIDDVDRIGEVIQGERAGTRFVPLQELEHRETDQ
jgi:isopentenyl phosphate kinase